MNQTEQEVIALFKFDTEGHIDRTGIEHGKFANHPHVATFAQERHGVAFLHTKRLQAGTETVDLLLDLGIGCGFKLLAGLFQQKCVIGIFAY